MRRRHRRANGGTSSPDQETAGAKRDAPAPDDARKPDSPDDLTKPSWKYILTKSLREFTKDGSPDSAAGLTYWAVMALPPALLALLSLLGLFGNSQQIIDDVLAEAGGLAGEETLGTVRTLLETVSQQETAGLALVTGLLVALWSASNYVNAFSRAMNRVYEVDEGRPFYRLRPTMLLVTLVMLLLVVVICVAMVLSGGIAETIGSVVGLSSQAVTIWNIAKWPVIVLLVVLTLAILYYATPNVKQPKMRWISVGSVVALVIWALATVAFGFYVGNFGNYDATYGALAGVIIFLLWLYITNNALLFGAEIDAEMERGRQLQAGIEAEETIQLPPRATKASDKKHEKYAADVARGRELRLSSGRPDGDEG
ncbi:YihY/virulence factor BrkB family protein [Actinotalea sp. K2]|uniref:YihY/virulence factor BrkB family protein n=1 Tax=Actinotalea sp. K2 TaxID=2939438 RepID=UPI002016D7AB|nr:YihY/virulence factor BrkB family protein [Actinotalea sp. K2]MCL3862793.1 YihY/virulence factor BrkB family protein [Actinotalea sp. K2]